MRIRSIKPEFWRDPDSTGRWPADLKLFYIGLWMVADDSGRFAWDEELIAADLFPFDRKADVGQLLERVLKTGRLVAYEAGGRRFGYLPKFSRHQRINRPTPSRLPEPPAGLPDGSVSAHGGLTAGRDQGAGSREDEREEAVTGAPSSRRPEDQVLELWNATAERAGLPKSRGSDKVRATIRSRLKAKAWLDAFAAGLAYLEASPFHRGENDRRWVASLEWLLKPGKAEELADKGAGGPLPGRAAPTQSLPTLNGQTDLG